MIFTSGAQQMLNPSASDLQAMRSTFRDEPWTGLVEAERGTAGRLAFLFFGGTIHSAYRLDPDTTQKRDAGLEWDSMLQSPPSRLCFNPLDVSALRILKIILEHPAPAETLMIKSGRLENLFDQWHQQPHPNLTALKFTGGDGLAMLWPGSPIPVAAFLTLSGGTTLADQAFTRMVSPDFGDCEASRYPFVSDGGAWEQYGFQFMFIRLLGLILVRYKELTGLALLNALDRNINRIALEHNWDFTITLGVITDRMLFFDLDQLLESCKMLLEVACAHIGVVLGQKLLRSLLQESFASLDAHSLRLVDKYSIDSFLGSPRVSLIDSERANG